MNPITSIDLRLEFRKSSGLYPDGKPSSLVGRIRSDGVEPELLEYLNWLEDELVKYKKIKRVLFPNLNI